MKTKFLSIFLLLNFFIFIGGCNPQSKDLEVTLKKDHLCAFTNNPKTHYGFDNTITVSTGKIDFTKEFQSNYEQHYKNGVLPINENTCSKIPLTVFEKSVVYEITLETNKIYHRSICIFDDNGHLNLAYIDPGKSTCD
ncbi:NF045616 family extracytoplasmic (lipo)protein [Acinetobacter junii]|uniref:NF045616 family extracytoplasmic (lipo)protein n=1 Tax=Acinetobacter junii TaxID=40215 RepID=UPI0002CFFD7D|nr:NF045616 family extracytoplasmic (lipo)protein [Acinetobacter junii]ENV64081.1 hypothetical protein F949_01469 [Acinetobacter junii NIPH 182]MBJ8439788.1 hypothetical protein [Acinetobacter junii]RZG65998.1 hypothetical protein EXE26_11375 [Acinetobacter junii]